MTEFGIFSDEGLLEGGFFDLATAQARAVSTYSEDVCHVAEVCSEHEDHERDTCEVCHAESCEGCGEAECVECAAADEDA